jgi:MFS family permease
MGFMIISWNIITIPYKRINPFEFILDKLVDSSNYV